MRRFHLILVNINVMILVTIFCAIVIYFSVKPISPLVIENRQLQNQRDNIQTQLDLSNEQYQLLTQEPYRLQQFRDTYHYSFEDEIIFEFPEEIDDK